MANRKAIYFPYELTGATGLYCRVLQTATNFWLGYDTWIFEAAPFDSHIRLTEWPAGSCVYGFENDTEPWADGKYQAFGYTAAGYLFAGGEIFILHDAEVGLDVLLDYMELIKKIESNSWELKEILGQAYWVVYDTDGTTELMRFKCFDQNGNSSMANIFKREKVA
jgi:hypothetical protein